MIDSQIKICKDQDAFSYDCSVIIATMPQYKKGARVKITAGIIKGTARCNMVYGTIGLVETVMRI
ncbi:hypothetical protein fh0823_20980 [Francisella halioticida]|uniref:hypothetical protein n=1 Tax=Francisella halioticida TaxID=549298 RepID=UPI001AF946AC|nr:hypothetical protein [Francisella halioticida]BCD91959.1 hypothetical protein fh0823_20980 [Francisella halioticida]